MADALTIQKVPHTAQCWKASPCYYFGGRMWSSQITTSYSRGRDGKSTGRQRLGAGLPCVHIFDHFSSERVDLDAHRRKFEGSDFVVDFLGQQM